MSTNNKTYLGNLWINYINQNRIERLVKDGPLIDWRSNHYLLGNHALRVKWPKDHFLKKSLRVQECLELVHTDVCGPLNVQAQGGFEYFIMFTDDHSRYGFIYLMHHKSEAFEKFR